MRLAQRVALSPMIQQELDTLIARAGAGAGAGPGATTGAI